MSILVKGMDMPRHCGECGIDWCNIWRRVETPIEKRPPDCPLVEMKDDHYYIMRDGTLYKARVATPEEMGVKTFNIKEYIENGNK